MFPSRVEDIIIKVSLEEVTNIFQWAKERETIDHRSNVVLVGGWAVDVYNSWYGSRDIDLMMTAKEKKELLNYLYIERKFERQRDEAGNVRYYRKVEDEEIVIDFVPKRQVYWKTQDVVKYEFRKPDLLIAKLRNQREVVVPSKSNLLLMKIKAAWDRSNQLREGVRYNSGYIESKFLKDCGDIIALLDRKYSQNHILDLKILAHELNKRPYLLQFLSEIEPEIYVKAGYRNLTGSDSSKMVSEFISLISKT